MQAFTLLGIIGTIHLITYFLNYNPDDRSIFLKSSYPVRVFTIAILILITGLFAGKQEQFIYFDY